MHRDFIIQNGVLEQYNGPGGDVVIPEGVTEIGYPAFRNCTSLTSIVIPKTVVQLNKFAFSGCTGLTKVEIAPGNKCFHIENGLVIAPKRRTLLFALSGLTSAVLPASVTIPEGIVKIECYAFVECASLTDVTIPASVAKIESFAFEGCNTLEKITILGKPEIGKKAFPASVAVIVAEQLRMEDYTVPANKQAAARGFALRYAAGETLSEDYRADCLKYIKSRKKTLYPAALQDPALLHVMLGEKMVPKVDLPDLIEQAAALGSAEMTAMLLAYQEQQLKPGEREQREETKTQREMDFLLTGTLTAAEAKKSWRYGKDKEGNLWILGYKGRETQVEVPAFIGKDKVVGIDRAAFSPDAHHLTEEIRTMRREITAVRLPETIVIIGGHAFQNCTALASVTLSEGIRKIGPCAFQDCTSLTDMTLPCSLQEIGECAFAGCTNLAGVTIPGGVYEISTDAFSGCTGLVSMEISPENKQFYVENGLLISRKKKSVRFALRGAASVSIPEEVTGIGVYAFQKFTSLTRVTIPESVKEIGWYAFADCTALTSVTIPEGVAKIGWYAFSGCTGLTSVTIPSSMTEISNYAFSGCTNLASVTIPEGVTKIDGCAFGSCASLTSVTLPASVKKMDQDVFWRCKGRVTIHAPAGSYAQQYAKENNIRFIAE